MTDRFAALRRRSYRLGYAVRSLYWRVRRPTTVGVRIAAITDSGSVVVVRHSYGPQSLYLPGGRVDRGETSAAAALRELHEETGIRPVGGEQSLDLFGVYTSQRGGLTSHISLFVVPAAQWESSHPATQPDGIEITEITTATIAAPPPGVSRATRRRLAELTAGRQEGFTW